MKKIEKQPKVYFIKEINPQNLLRLYQCLGVSLKPKVAVKLSTGEPGGHNFLNPQLIKPLVDHVGGTIVECCTAYQGRRYDPVEHQKVLKEHGFLAVAPCDIMDAEGEMEIPVRGGFHMPYDIVGKNLKNYGSMLVLSHFKGHAMGGFSGALKNISIGVASRNGKAYIHSVCETKSPEKMMQNLFGRDQDEFIECMADASKAVIDYVGPKNMAYVSVANRLSVDCDCSDNPREPEMADIGMFASLDPVALDQACYDAVMNSTDKGKKSLVERMEKMHAIHIVESAEQLGLGSRDYQLIELK